MYRTSLATKLKLFSRFVRKFSFVCVSENQENLIVDVGKGKEVFPLVWLRDNCRCPSCFHKSSTSRIINWVDFNVSPKATSVQTTSDGNIVLQWNDKHISTFSLDWLKKRSFKEDAQQLYLHDNYRPTKVPWSCETFESIKKTYEYEDLLKSDEVLYNWLFDYARYGIVFINNVPDEKHAAAKLCKRIGVIKSTHYEEEFKIKHIPGTSNVAYLSDALQLHTDLPYYDYVPGVFCK
uniref:TauD/TfdA-like domain-containing protein n=1 Tax=Photinus pyralis TaxID=7054 RepID=A0A1Y1LF55_PHOPY